MNALYCIVILLPIIPTSMPQYLQDLFDIFLYLSTWNYTKVPRLTEDQLIHLQIGLSIFFQRLYGMFPCNFVAYLREVTKDHRLVFQHTINPMLETVKMHPMLLTSNRDLEKNNTRWKEMEPHDVVVECSKFSLDYLCGTTRSTPDTINATTDCLHNMPCRAAECGNTGQQTSSAETPVSVQLQNSLRNTPYSVSGLSSTFYAPFNEVRQLQPQQRIDSLWSPLLGVLATPPPSGGTIAPHTPTPSIPSYAVQTIPASSQQQCASGASPPEAAVEATPETTPMKDSVQAVRSFPPNSTAVRAIWGVSQPSSPMKTESAGAAFRYADIPASQIVSVEQHRLSSPKIMNFVTERSMYQSQMHTMVEKAIVVTTDTILPKSPPPLSPHAIDDQPSNLTTTCASSLEDLEVTDIDRFFMRIGSSAAPDNGTSGICIPNSGSVENYTEHFQQWHSQMSKSLPAESMLAKRRQRNRRKNSNTPSPHEDDEDSGEKESDTATIDPPINLPLLRSKRNNFAKRPNPSIGTQTLDQVPSTTYDQMFLELVNVEGRKSTTVVPPPTEANQQPLSPHTLLDQYIETSIRKRQPNENNNLTEQIQLLNLLLQYERYRREVHAERNRRLLGKSRVNAGLEMDNDRLRREKSNLTKEVEELTVNLNKARIARNQQDRDYAKELAKAHQDHQHESEANQQLRATIESLQRRVGDEETGTRSILLELEAARAELFDLRNELQQTQYQADMGQHYKDEVHRLQSEVALMGEIQMKCKEKLSEINNLKARDAEMDGIRHAYDEEVRGKCQFKILFILYCSLYSCFTEMRLTMDLKCSQLDSAKARLLELESQLSRRDSMFTDQKRLLKTVKEEYQDKFRSLEEKYLAQKAIILRMEEELLELHNKNQAAVNPTSTHVSSDSDRAGKMNCLIDLSWISLP